jgi:hypothetical protein
MPYYGLKFEGKIAFIIPWNKEEDPTLHDFENAIASVWGRLGSDLLRSPNSHGPRPQVVAVNDFHSPIK